MEDIQWSDDDASSLDELLDRDCETIVSGDTDLEYDASLSAMSDCDDKPMSEVGEEVDSLEHEEQLPTRPISPTGLRLANGNESEGFQKHEEDRMDIKQISHSLDAPSMIPAWLELQENETEELEVNPWRD